MNNARGVTVECLACGWQGDESLTDARYCPDCGGECAELQEIYADTAEPPLPAWQATNCGHGIPKGCCARCELPPNAKLSRQGGADHE